MHVPDGFFEGHAAAVSGGIAAGAIVLSGVLARRGGIESRVPFTGLVATTIFAAQMMNFPVGQGVSGHLIGGALAAALLGPARGILASTVVVVTQALLFADGGVTAMGVNVLLLAIVPVLVSWAVIAGLTALLPSRRWALPVAGGIAGAVSVPAAALVFSLLFAWGGSADVPVGALTAQMLGWHSLIGLGEAVATGALVAAVVLVRPDLVAGLRGERPPAHPTAAVPA